MLVSPSGHALVECWEEDGEWRGASSTHSFSASPSVAAACGSLPCLVNLSEVLETGQIPQRFFLSARACAGILRRAERRGKALPEALRAALEVVAADTPS